MRAFRCKHRTRHRRHVIERTKPTLLCLLAKRQYIREELTLVRRGSILILTHIEISRLSADIPSCTLEISNKRRTLEALQKRRVRQKADKKAVRNVAIAARSKATTVSTTTATATVWSWLSFSCRQSCFSDLIAVILVGAVQIGIVAKTSHPSQ